MGSAGDEVGLESCRYLKGAETLGREWKCKIPEAVACCIPESQTSMWYYPATASGCDLLQAIPESSAFTPLKSGAETGILIATGLSGYTPLKCLDILMAVNSIL